MPDQRVVTLTTDFGLNDHFVGTMRGVILNVNPAAHIVDICNAVPSFDLLDGALTIAQSYSYFPSGTVHMVIVDPGVGSSRRPILVSTTRHHFIAPDNGVLSLVLEREERFTVRHITSEHYFLQPVSQTFHGRDVFAPCAGWLSKGVEPAKFGEEISDYVRFTVPKPKPVSTTTLKGVVLKIDKFGNLITNIAAEHAPSLFSQTPARCKIVVGDREINGMKSSYSQGAAGELFGIIGSMGYLEIAANRGAASQIVKVNRGSEVQIIFENETFATR